MSRIETFERSLNELTADQSAGSSPIPTAVLAAAVLLFIAAASALSSVVRGLTAAMATLATLAMGAFKFFLAALFALLLIAALVLSGNRNVEDGPSPDRPQSPVPTR